MRWTVSAWPRSATGSAASITRWTALVSNSMQGTDRGEVVEAEHAGLVADVGGVGELEPVADRRCSATTPIGCRQRDQKLIRLGVDRAGHRLGGIEALQQDVGVAQLHLVRARDARGNSVVASNGEESREASRRSRSATASPAPVERLRLPRALLSRALNDGFDPSGWSEATHCRGGRECNGGAILRCLCR